VTEFVLDASVALQWLLEDESDRVYSLQVLKSLATNVAVVPPLWFYEVGNGLLMASRRGLISLPALANTHRLTVYDAAYLALARRLQVPLATNDAALRRVANALDVKVAAV